MTMTVRLIIALALLVAMRPPVARAAQHLPTTVVAYLVVPPDETLLPTDPTAAMQATQAALAWWGARTPTLPPFVLSAPLRIISLPRPGDPGWTAPIPRYPADANVAVWVYANRDPFYTLPGGATGHASGGNVFVMLEQRQFPWSLAAAIAHELGHVRYDLPDLYRSDPACVGGVDVMCNPDTAYVLPWLGCRSLALLGTPCRATYLPLLV